MSRLTQVVFAAVLGGAVLLVAPSCGKAACGPSSCNGCCDATGLCQPGRDDAFCGAAGQSCVACSGAANTCSLGTCVAGGTGGGTGSTGGGSAMGGGTGTGGGSGACTKTTVACSDAAIQQLDLKMNPNAAPIVNTADGSGWASTIDSTAGGITPTMSYVYAKFTATGLTQVSLGDQAAIDSMGWDIAFRRFVIRLNGGDSGPACVSAALLPTSTTYDTVTSVPAGLSYGVDNFLDQPPGCAFIPDTSGLGTSPRVVLAPWYKYTSCVTTSGQVFVVQTSDGRHVKLVVTTYYATEAGQTACNTNGSSGGVPGGTIRLRWQFLD